MALDAPRLQTLRCRPAAVVNRGDDLLLRGAHSTTSCVEQVLRDGAEPAAASRPAPIRPRTAWHAGLSLARANRPLDRRRHAGFDADEFADFRGRIEQPPSER